MTVYYATFKFEEARHIAIGEDEWSRPVYRQSRSGGKYYLRRVRFPSWLKFVDEDEFSDVVEGEGESLEAVLDELQIELDEGNGESA